MDRISHFSNQCGGNDSTRKDFPAALTDNAAAGNTSTIKRLAPALLILLVFGMIGPLWAESGSAVTELHPLKRTSIKVQLLQARSLLPPAESTNPFDFQEVKEDIENAQAGTSSPVALAVTPSFLAGPAIITSPPAVFNIDPTGSPANSLILMSSGGFDATATALQAALFGTGTAQFTAGPAWGITGSSNGTTVSDTISPSFYVRRNSGGNYYKIQVSFISSINLEISALSGFNCGSSMVGC
ncbi:MAG: hypothetical protein ABW148_16540 [Sedimenticola sp.]